MKNGSITYDGHSLIINGKREILIGGEFHYFRTPWELWEDRLKKVKQAGCNLITTYIPWNFHEAEKGKLIWKGDRDLPGFLKLCRKYNLYVIIKPGPYICAEWDFGGFPHWLLSMDIPLRLPDKEYLTIVNDWYGEVAKIIIPHLVTNGGNIVLVQIENEYDHLIEEGGIVKSKEEARRYLLTLLDFVRQAKINVPAYTNEGSCILGTEIINTHTYYPNIPWIWMWEFNDFDRKIEEGRIVQSDKPLMILELEAGWFAQYGQPLYNVETEVTDAIMKTVLTYGASVLNYYMAVGGTSFPYWSAKGDFGGIGICTTFDFGAAPVREWGEIHEKYHHLRNYAYMVQSFPEFILEGETTTNGVDLIKGDRDIVRLYKDRAQKDSSFKGSYENVKILYRKNTKYGMILVRNLEDEETLVRISFHSRLAKKMIRFPGENMKLPAHSSLLLPADFTISDSVKIIYSTSEIILKKKIGEKEYIILKGSKKIEGEMALVSPDRFRVVKGDIKKTKRTGDKLMKVTYSHDEISVFEIQDYSFMILPEEEANKLWMDNGFLMLSDLYHLEDWEERADGIHFDFQIKPKSKKQKITLYSSKEIKKVTAEGKALPIGKKKQDTKAMEVDLLFNEKSSNKIEYIGDWFVSPDTDEKEPGFNDRSWIKIKSDTPLEKAKIFEHGYYWFRNEFILPEGAGAVKLKMQTNEMDRFTVYVNGHFRWIGIGSPELDITEMVQKGKNIIAISYENAFHTKAHPHEGPIKKLSGLYEPVSVVYKLKNKKEEIPFKEWKVMQGLGGDHKKYYSPDFDERTWLSVPEAKMYVFQEEFGNIIWMRRKFKMIKKDDWVAPLYIQINECHDRCLIYVNGSLLGKYEEVGPQHRFYIPENYLKEENLLCLVVEGPGFHPVKGFGFLPPKITEPEIGFFYEAKKIKVEVNY